MNETVNIVVLKRNLRLKDNKLIQFASGYSQPVMLLYVFDDCDSINIRQKQFVFRLLEDLNRKLSVYKSSVLVMSGDTYIVLEDLLQNYNIANVFVGDTYERSQILLFEKLKELCLINQAQFHTVNDYIIFAPGEILKNDGTPYTVFTPFKNKWLQQFSTITLHFTTHDSVRFYPCEFKFPEAVDIINEKVGLSIKDYKTDVMKTYEQTRDFPSKDGGSYLGPHLRFGSVSISEIVTSAVSESSVFLSELIWREFFMHIMYYFPHTVNKCFRSKYEFVRWRNNEDEFERWCKGQTGIPIVDAGMRELNETGYMHNRVRMIAASFLCKHLLIDWRWGEAYFATKLLDYELSSNVGNWQWVAGTGCDAAPYFRIFNPLTQQEKFDPDLLYVRKWVEEFDSPDYCLPFVDLKKARERAIKAYKMG